MVSEYPLDIYVLLYMRGMHTLRPPPTAWSVCLIHLHVDADRAVVVVNTVSAIALTIQERAQQAGLALPSFAKKEHPRLPHGRASLRPQLPQV